MSTPPEGMPPHIALRALASHLTVAATAYRVAWQAHRAAVDAWQVGLSGVVEKYGEGSPPAVAAALSAFNTTVEQALLLDIDVEDEALRQMNFGASQLEAVAAAARKVADALVAEEGGLQ